MADDLQTSVQGQPPQAPGQAQPLARKRPRKTMWIVGGALLAALVCAALVGGILLCSCGGKTKPPAPVPWKLSAAQRLVVHEFGPPQTFSVICASDPAHDQAGKNGFPIHRVEIWSYHDLGAQFLFRDGHALDEKSIPVLQAGTTYPQLRPEEFYRGMSVNDVVKVIGGAPAKSADIAPDIFEGLQAYEFGNQVMAEFDNGRLAGVQTVPVIPTGGK